MNCLLFACVILLAATGGVFSDINDLDLDDTKNQLLEDVKKQLPDLDLDKARAEAPSLEDVEKTLREKCDKNGGEGAYDNVETQKALLQECIESQVNVTAVQEELEEAKKTGSMDEVFAKYCKKIPDVMVCVKNVTNAVKPCLEEREQDSLKILSNITESLLDFACFKDGDRIAMFIAEGGVKCLEERKKDVEGCVNKTVEGKVPTSLNINTIPLLIFGAEECQSFDELHKCTVAELEKCKENTPANIIDALFKFARKTSPCRNYSARAASAEAVKEGSSSSATLKSSLVLSVLLPFIVRRYV